MKYILLIFAFSFLTSCSSSYSKAIISTKSTAIPPHKVLGKAEFENCWADFKKMYNGVLDQAREMGGDAIMDFQLRNTSITSVFGYIKVCHAAVGTVIKFDSSEGSSAWDALPDAVEEEKTKSVWD
ncbi:MAG: hypothetical protein LBU89_13485 [Fibromonadaceae bacterium]|jgi:hypothetical protein|nr:hypothetical protein [Fibromonadaceae bacterium]